ncbi:putative exosome 3 [Achaetomium macrosporum]|uniref:Exosome 3 n=1 Tax=Achaetomium macrosporum TaxID=79813 RepID=A0AAN7CHK5_9PEZI|nr:putative exosome 3 [Achaetomium macrosporum]
MTTSVPTLAIPGQLLGPASRYQPGPGTHLHESNLYSSLLGQVHITQPARAPGPVKRLTKITPAPAPAELPTISVAPVRASPSGSAATSGGDTKKREVLPDVGNVVLCRVIRITPRQAVVAILVCGDTVLDAEWQGLIRVQDVRATEKDRVKIYESFRPGDIVRAEVISLGDQANYYLSTARNELGVILATSEAGNTMYPVNWKEYRDPDTGLTELRKVAKPY